MNKILFILIGAFILLLGGLFLLNNYAPIPTPAPLPAGEPITIKGEITCLPKIGPGPHTEECAIGLREIDSRHYGLKNLSRLDPEYKFSVTGLPVEVFGTFWPEEMPAPRGAYDIVGTIDVTSIKEDFEGQEIMLQEGQRENSFLLQKIYPDRVEGLNFWEHPIAIDQGNPVTLRIGEVVSNGCTVQLTLIGIEGNTAVFTKKTDFNRPCPICLAENTLIDTPSGAIAVQNLQKGDAVWTLNKAGERVVGLVLETSRVPVPLIHQVMHIVLEDGRELFASPGHPTTDGRTVGELFRGDVLDSSRVVSAVFVSYREGYTYDILPSGETGFYWANSILLDSTLH